MKAWILQEQGPIEDHPLTLVELPVPNPGPGDIRIHVQACGVCRTDVHIAEGDLPLHKQPVIPGHEVVGIVDAVGHDVSRFRPGDRVGVAWINHACGVCKHCREGRENLCADAKFTGWDADGGYAEYMLIDHRFAFTLPNKRLAEKVAPWMCPGIAGYRSLRLTRTAQGHTLGLFGFGPTATYVLQVAKHRGLRVFVVTRSEKNKQAARKLGADWVGGYDEQVPATMDGAIVFPPVGDLVSVALSHLASGGTLVLSPVTMSPIRLDDFNQLWQERSITTLAHVTRRDGAEFLLLADKMGLDVNVERFSFAQVPEALIRVKHGDIRGNAVIMLGDS